ncbi:MAG: enoyl-CoA hydratase-related protein [Sulfurovum sp.]|nr:enoyl-CoA hydratase-related protein [Sulfurovum sp.]
MRDRGYTVDVTYAGSRKSKEEIEVFDPDMILSPYLIHKVPKAIYERYPTYILHPGPIGDRGAYSLENMVCKAKDGWGAVILKANDVWDGGDIYFEERFGVDATTSRPKASFYRNEIKAAYYTGFDRFFDNIASSKYIPQQQNPLNTDPKCTIDWENDTTKMIKRKIDAYDSHPGIVDEILGMRVHLFGAWEEEKLKGKAKEILAKRDGAICLGTKDGAVWITHLKEPGRFKLPATYVLKERLKGVREERLPLIFDRSYRTFYEVSCDIEGDVGYLYFNFHNGAFRAEQCIRLKYAIEYLKSEVKVLVLMGGEDFFSNGINLNILEDSKKSGEDGWATINAINDLVGAVLYAGECVTIASLHRNAGAGGVFLAAACDYVVAREDVVLNPHYKTLGLSGSEYHTYTLPKRVGEEEGQKLLDACLPISAAYAQKIGLADAVFPVNGYETHLKSYAVSLTDDAEGLDDFLWQKQEYIEEHSAQMEACKEQEIEVMYPEFWDSQSPFHALRSAFVYKVCPAETPQRLRKKDSNA